MLLAVPDAAWSFGALILLVLVLALIFRRTIEEVLLPNVSGIKVLGLEVSFAKEALGEASKSRGLPKAGPDQSAAFERAREAWPLLQGAEVLWVDDDPPGNRPERRMLHAFGVMISAVTTNAEARMMLRYNHYDLIISDIDRGGDADDGLVLAREIGSSKDPIPLIFYIGDPRPERGTPAYAFGITGRPDHLLHYVIDVLARSRRKGTRG